MNESDVNDAATAQAQAPQAPAAEGSAGATAGPAAGAGGAAVQADGVTKPYGWAIVDRRGIEAFSRPALGSIFGHHHPNDPVTQDDVERLDREFPGAAPHRLVTLYTTPQPSTEPADPYDAIWNALQRIDTAAALLPTYSVRHKGGIEGFTQNIVDAIAAAAAPAEPLPVDERAPFEALAVANGCDVTRSSAGGAAYKHRQTADYWAGWLELAALPPSPAPQPVAQAEPVAAGLDGWTVRAEPRGVIALHKRGTAQPHRFEPGEAIHALLADMLGWMPSALRASTPPAPGEGA